METQPVTESYVDKVARMRALAKLVPPHERDAVALYLDLADLDLSNVATESMDATFHRLSSTSQAYIKLYQEVSGDA